MSEKRRHKRTPVGIKVVIDSLYNQKSQDLGCMKEEIEIVNISESGIGFVSGFEFPLFNYFNARIVMDKDHYIFGVLKIIRKDEEAAASDEVKSSSKQYYYGCEFVGMADILSTVISDYAKKAQGDD